MELQVTEPPRLSTELHPHPTEPQVMVTEDRISGNNTKHFGSLRNIWPQTDRLPLLSGTRSIVPSQIHLNLAGTRLVVLSTNLLVLLRRLLTGSGDLAW